MPMKEEINIIACSGIYNQFKKYFWNHINLPRHIKSPRFMVVDTVVDLVLIKPSSGGMLQLLDICNEFGL